MKIKRSWLLDWNKITDIWTLPTQVLEKRKTSCKKSLIRATSTSGKMRTSSKFSNKSTARTAKWSRRSKHWPAGWTPKTEWGGASPYRHCQTEWAGPNKTSTISSAARSRQTKMATPFTCQTTNDQMNESWKSRIRRFFRAKRKT